MKVDLLKYMSDRMQEAAAKKASEGPVITISRQYGCPAKKVAKMLSEHLTTKLEGKGIKDSKWSFVTKEIMNESAKELELDPSDIKYVFDYEKKSIIDDILVAHSNKYYKSDRKIRNTIAKVIRNMAKEGHKVIVGRGGVAITRDIADSFHINLEAPIEWRVLRISEKYNLSLEDAEKSVKDIDKKRKEFREFFEGKGTDYTRFDLTFNCMTLSIEEIVDIIVKAAELRNLVHN